jgi:F-type H+-transporting ATPase subunit delta
MKTEALIRRYSQSFLKVTLDESSVHHRELRDVMAVLKGLGKSGKLVLNKTAPISVKRPLLNEIMGVAKLSQYTVNFLNILLCNGRINLLPKIVDSIGEMVLEAGGYKKVSVVSSIELGTEVKERVTRELEQLLGAKISMQYIVDQKILGGCMIKYDTFMLDLSVRCKLNQIKASLLSQHTI